MARAVQLARLGHYSTSPNPRVGCVLVKEGRIIGEGFHQVAGEGHAEINALAAADTFVKGATAYVTLEPCSHEGKTPPCANALLEAGISRLVYGMEDPNPQVSGRGLDRLRNGGVTVDGPLLESECAALNPGFIQRMQTGLPRVTSKIAASMDGKTAMQSGESQWITGPEARADVQRLRAQSCAIVTGIDTVIADDPQLNVRDAAYGLANFGLRQPLRVIVDSQLRIDVNAKIFSTEGDCLVVYAKEDADKLEVLQQQGVETLQLANSQGQVDLAALLQALGKRQLNEVMLEAGAKLNAAFVEADLIDEVILYMAPTLLGNNARSLMALPLDNMSQQRRLDVKAMRQIGDDYRWQLQFSKDDVAGNN